MMIKIVADNKIPFLKGALEPFAEVLYISGREISNEILKNADALIIRTRTICNKELLEHTKVKFIASATIGYDHIDIDYCKSRNIKWTNAPGCNSGSVMQYIASALVRLSIKYNFDFSEKTLGIIGNGNVGSKVSKAATALGFRVLVNDPPLHRASLLDTHVSLKEIKEKADIISLHVPLNMHGIDKTFRLVDQNFLKTIKPSSILINSSRGNVVDTNALKEALKKKFIKGVVLDVWKNEPHIDIELLDLVDFATPHIAGYSADGKAKGTAMSVQAISDFFGFGLKKWFPVNVPKPLNPVLAMDFAKKTERELFSEMLLATYDIQSDNERLKTSVETFEKQREEYPLRREFENYSIKSISRNKNFEERLQQLGFRIER